ncbi:hypothetical protein KM043_013516 [Ampulex compressa]|nr:hypothetical protein KM043_013516 [Ampulex compressa]
MSEISEIATVVDAKKIKETAKEKQNNADKMEVDNPNKVYDSKTLRNQHGNYPVWMNKRKILKHKKGRAKSQKATAKKTGKRLTRKQIKAAKEK